MEPKRKVRTQLDEEERKAIEDQTKASNIFASLPGNGKFTEDVENVVNALLGVEEIDETEMVEQSANGSFFIRVKRFFKRSNGKDDIS